MGNGPPHPAQRFGWGATRKQNAPEESASRAFDVFSPQKAGSLRVNRGLEQLLLELALGLHRGVGGQVHDVAHGVRADLQ